MSNITLLNPSNESKALYFAQFIYYKKESEKNVGNLLNKHSELLTKYGIDTVLSMNITEKEAITGVNTFDKPDEILIHKVENVDHYNQFLNDSEYDSYLNDLKSIIRKMTYVVGTKIEYREMSSESPLDQRLYALGMLFYKPDGRKKLKEFTDKAVPLFMKHSFYADNFLDILDKGAFIGEVDDFTLPDELRVFWSDTHQDLENYNNDPEYHAIKHIREEGVADYPTFLGTHIKQ